MRTSLKAALLSLLIPSTCFAGWPVPVGGFFQQGVNVENASGQAIMVSDAAAPELQNKQVAPGYTLEVAFPSDQLTNGAGQTFSHTVSIHSAADYSLICTVQSHLQLSETGMHLEKPTSSNETRCKAASLMTIVSGKTVLGMSISVS